MRLARFSFVIIDAEGAGLRRGVGIRRNCWASGGVLPEIINAHQPNTAMRQAPVTSETKRETVERDTTNEPSRGQHD